MIGGYTAPGGSRQGFGALLVGLYDRQGRLEFAGKVGTGFDEKRLQSMTRRLAALKKADPPFANPPKEKGVQWVRPALVAEVAFAERTQEGIVQNVLERLNSLPADPWADYWKTRQRITPKMKKALGM